MISQGVLEYRHAGLHLIHQTVCVSSLSYCIRSSPHSVVGVRSAALPDGHDSTVGDGVVGVPEGHRKVRHRIGEGRHWKVDESSTENGRQWDYAVAVGGTVILLTTPLHAY